LDSRRDNCYLEYACVFAYPNVSIMKNNFFESKYFVWCLIIILALVLISLFRESYRYFQTSKEIKNIENKIENFKKENEELLRIKETFDSEEFLEEEARKKLNMVKEGESVIIITGDNELELEEPKIYVKTTSSIKLWLKYFFEK
jgi:cell division protein FtsB